MTTYTNPVQKLYYYHLLGRNKGELENVINENSKNQPLDNYVSVVLHKTRERTALLSLYDRQEEKTIELEKILNSAVPKFRGAVSFLRMLFESMAKNLYEMEKILEKHEKRYEYDSNTIYCDNVFENLWELKSYAYDYYFFLIKNGIPLHYFSDSKEYLSYYIRAVLCTYSPIKERTDEFNIPVARNVERYTLGEIEIDMLVKYTDSQSLQAWIKKYSVQALEIDKEIDIVNRFVNLCNSFVRFKIRYWLKQLTNFAVVLCLANLNEEQKKDIYITIATTMEKFAIELPHVNEELFETVEYIVHHMNIEDQNDAYQKLIDVITNENVYSTIVNRHSSKIQYIFRKAGKFATQQERERIESKIMSSEDIKEVCKKIYNFRFLLSKENCRMFFNEHSELLSVSQIFNLLIEGMLDYNEQLLDKFVETIRKEDAARKKNPAMRTFPDWLMVTLEYSLLLKLLKFPIDLNLLSPYVEYSEHLQFMLKPDEFDYSKVDTKNYMWQNLIYSDEYKHYFVDNRGEILTEQLKSIFDLGVETVAQQKIIYGILLADNELRQY